MSKKNKPDARGFVFSTDPNFSFEEENNDAEIIYCISNSTLFYGIVKTKRLYVGFAFINTNEFTYNKIVRINLKELVQILNNLDKNCFTIKYGSFEEVQKILILKNL